MSDLKYDIEKLNADAEAYLDKFRSRMKDIVNETFGELYVNSLPYIETDSWTNYREALRIELEHEYKYSKFKEPWAVNFRRAVFIENRNEFSNLISKDILDRIKQLEDRNQEFEMFRYSPGGDNYQDIKHKLESALTMLDEMAKALEKVCARNDIGEAILDYYGDCSMALDKYKKFKEGL